MTINQLVSIVEEIAEIDVERRYKLDAPQGVRGRNSDNTLILERFGWEPSISLRDGMEQHLPLDLRPDGRVRALRHGRRLRSTLTLAVLTNRV